MIDAPAFIAHQERFAIVGSTNDVVREWLASGTPEVCLAIADEQSAGRGRAGRRWEAPPGAALLLSLGFRPSWLAPEHVWRLAATAMLAMADAAEEIAGLPERTIGLKWPNDLVVMHEDAATGTVEVRKVAGVLGETEGLGTDDPRVVVGIGLNADWATADFPPDLTDSMTSLREASDGRRIDRELLLDSFLRGVAVRIHELREGRFDAEAWAGRQVLTGHLVRMGGDAATFRVLGVDAHSGGLVVADPAAPGGDRTVVVGEVEQVRLVEGV